MARYHAEITVKASPDAAFSYLSDLANLSDWDSSVRRASLVEGDGPALGARYDVTVGFYGKALDATYEIVEFDAPRRLAYTINGKARGRTEITVAERDGTTVVGYDATLTMGGLARLLDRGLQVAYDGIGENVEKGIAKQLKTAR